MARRSTIEKLPEDVRRWLERALTESGFSGYNELESLLRERGYVISKSAIHRYGQKIERRYGSRVLSSCRRRKKAKSILKNAWPCCRRWRRMWLRCPARPSTSKSSSLKYGPERSRQPATPRKLPVRGDCQATQYRRFVARFWGLPHDKIIRSDFKRRWRRPRRDESHGREE